MRSVILFSTHLLNDYIICQIEKLNAEIQNIADFYVLLQCDNNIQQELNPHIKVFPFSIDSLNSLGYCSWRETIVPGSNHFPVLQFFKAHPEYDYYWNIEYDVLFSGDWNVLFDWFEDKNEDFVSTHIETISEKPQWEHWNDIELKEEDNIDRSSFIKSFNPIYRISNKALAFIDSFLLKGNRGHHELLLPTVLNYNGFSIKDMGGSGNYTYEENDLFYTSDGTNTWYSDSSMRFRPLYHTEDVIIPNKLYHPIKEVAGNYSLGMDIIKDFNVILHDTEWIRDKNIYLSDFAVDEAYMMHMIKILETYSFKNILDLGCGQTTLLLSQYAETHQADLLTIESDTKLADKLQMEHPIVNVKKYVQYYHSVTNEASMYLGLTRDLLLQKNKFDFISVDGPYGVNCEHMSRINILELISNGLMADNFVIMLHNINRMAEMNTAIACTSLLDALGIKYHKVISWFGRGTFIISNVDGICNY